ncbi:MAG: T9SS type A sorting domain-containing protein, partial [Bacteroidales bacterium]|nr:T9SS type A sorting domain-containing protein [Bacteroidales bacterium]
SPTISTTYVVTGTGANGCTKTIEVSVVVKPLPNILAPEDSTICQGVSIDICASGGSDYTWSNSFTGNCINISPTLTTTYTVTGADGNGCENSDTIIVIVDICSGIADMESSYLRVYPNPTSNNITIEIPQTSRGSILSVYDISGKQIMQKQLKETRTNLDVRGLPNGMYFLKLVNAKGVNVIKFVKED